MLSHHGLDEMRGAWLEFGLRIALLWAATGPDTGLNPEPEPSGQREPILLLQALDSRLPIGCTIGHEPAC